MSDILDIPLVPPTLLPPQGVDLQAFTLAYLESHDAECPACGYNVRALQVARCPECGQTLTLRVVSPQSGFTWAWICCLLACGLSAGIGLFVMAIVLHEGFPRNVPRIFVLLLLYLGCIPFPLFLLIVRRWFVRMPSPLQWAAAVLSALAGIVLLGWFIKEIMH